MQQDIDLDSLSIIHDNGMVNKINSLGKGTIRGVEYFLLRLLYLLYYLLRHIYCRGMYNSRQKVFAECDSYYTFPTDLAPNGLYCIGL